MKHAKGKYFWIASITMTVLLGSMMFAPTLSAYAEKGHSDPPKHQDPPKNNSNTNNNSNGDKDDNHQKDRKDKDDHDPQRCLHGASGKYNKHCDDFEGHPGRR